MQTHNENSKTSKTIEAVDELLRRQTVIEYTKDLCLLHSAFVRSDFADDQRTRILVDSTFQNIRDFLMSLNSINSQNQQA